MRMSAACMTGRGCSMPVVEAAPPASQPASSYEAARGNSEWTVCTWAALADIPGPV